MAKISDSEFKSRLTKLTQDTTLDQEVRDLLLNALQQLDQGAAPERVATALMSPMSLLAVQQKLNGDLIKLLTDLRETYQGWGKRGMGVCSL